MSRPALLFGLAVCLVSAGCLGPALGADTTTEPTREPTTVTTSQATTTPAETNAVGETTTPCMCVEDPLELWNRYEGNVTVTAVNLDGGDDVEQTLTETGRYEFEDRFEPTAEYRLEIRVDGELVWERPLENYERYHLRVNASGGVEVVSYSVV
ncbi:hypothetical protein [Haloarchaeobius sp. HME9146]|uniref:hypothetical protein n=1 Tax=Haloarchaeobius sp. HME9146 TaxID=2978732 RepID=UPI0021BE061C|nr:hypothetical protein [Haloarchaeobius sp. HME9146]MCT9096921.1 hypothetical protein [Haloarchaeobius sp. HME9146]